MKVILILKNGDKQELDVDGVDSMHIVDKGMRTQVVFPKTDEDGYIQGSVHVIAILGEFKNKDMLPKVTLTAGEWYQGGWDSCASASMYITPNGRIMGRNATLGYASNEKPLAVKPYKRVDR